MPFELRALAFRTIATTLVALAVLLALTSLPGKSTTALGPIETTVCADENGRDYTPSFDVLIEPTWSPAADAMIATQHLRAPTLVPDIRRPTHGVLRL
jgi:hypothetical protein